MAPRKQPTSLHILCQTSAALHLSTACDTLLQAAQETSTAHVLQRLSSTWRPYYENVLPPSERAALINMCSQSLSKKTSLYGTDDTAGRTLLFVLSVLLDPGIRDLRVVLCCYYGCSDQERMLHLLRRHGSGLQQLQFCRSSLLRLDRDLFADVLSNASGLQELSMRNIATDSVLDTIGRCCQLLRKLDVSHSKQVTDAGVEELCLRIHFEDNDSKETPRSCCWSWVRRRSPEDVLLRVVNDRNPLCNSLLELHLCETSVTHLGLRVALIELPKLETFGGCSDVASVIYTTVTKHPLVLSLVNVTAVKSPIEYIEAVLQHCPHLRRLSVVEPRFLFGLLPNVPALTSFKATAIPPHPRVVTDLTHYILQMDRMYELELDFASDVLLPPLNILELSLPKLSLLRISNASLFASPPPEQTCQLTHVHLGHTVRNEVLSHLLYCAPSLRSLHLRSCPNLTDHVLAQALTLRPHHQLRCFYVYEAPSLSLASLYAVLSDLPEIMGVGNLRKWGGVDCEDVRRFAQDVVKGQNLNVELLSGAHWYSYNCFD